MQNLSYFIFIYISYFSYLILLRRLPFNKLVFKGPSDKNISYNIIQKEKAMDLIKL